MIRTCSVVLLAMAAGCDAGAAALDVDARSDGDAAPQGTHDADAAPPDAQPPDAGPPPYQCQVLDLAPADACAIALTGEVTPCWIDPETMLPSQDGSLAVRRPDGATGYLCSNAWSSEGGVFYGSRAPLLDSPAGCCGGSAGAPLDWPASDAFFGAPHGPTHIKRWETMSNTGGGIRDNPFAVVVSSPASAAAFQEARLQWQAWAGDGQEHSGPNGPGAYYFPPWVVINYVVVPTTTGAPLIVIAPEVSRNPSYIRPLGHPTLGACATSGGAPLAYFGGEVHGTVITNHSGRFSAGSATTPANLANTASLFNCYGITVTGVQFQDPSDY